MPAVQSIQRQLREVNWDFTGAFTGYATHRFHWYPGTFIPQIPAYLMEIVTKKGDTVYDPYCGMGTTLVEAVRLGRYAIGSDLNPIACMVAQTKTDIEAISNLQAIEKLAKGFLDGDNLPVGLFSCHPTIDGISPTQVGEIASMRQHLKEWYHPETFHQLCTLWAFVISEVTVETALKSVFSSILKHVSSQRLHWGYVADNVRPKAVVYVDPYSAFLRHLQDLIRGLRELRDSTLAMEPSSSRRATVVQSDLSVQAPIAECSVDAIITSPPYPNVSDYIKSQRLTCEWFGYSVQELKSHEIGARWKRSRHSALSDYQDELGQSLRTIAPSVKPGGHCCLVIGPSDRDIIEEQVVPAISGVFASLGFAEIATGIERKLSQQRVRSRKPNQRTERILVYRRSD